MNGYIVHKKESDWGTAWYFMAPDGHSFARAYVYADDQDNITLDWLSVSPEYRRNGDGTALQLAREALGRQLGCKNSCLWVKKGTWMLEWYKRRGYVEYKEHEDGESVWMSKRLEE